jgi:clan AA aspartic protease
MLLPVRKTPGESKMGLTHVAVQLRSLSSKEIYVEDFLVDTGAMDSMAPASVLRKIGIEPVGKTLYELANGQLEEYEYGLAEISFMGHTTAGEVIFGPENTEPLLGVITLQAAGFIVDPRHERLRKLRARPLKAAIYA